MGYDAAGAYRQVVAACGGFSGDISMHFGRFGADVDDEILPTTPCIVVAFGVSLCSFCCPGLV